ncbi:hypothetical protein D3C84_825130 [compost metagenome]
MHGTLQIKVIVDVRGIRQIVFGEQFAIEHHMVLRGMTVPQFFQVGAQQPFETVVVPVLDHAIQPGAVDPFGRRHGLQEVQGVGLAAEELPRAAVFAPLQVVSVLPGHTGAVLLDPGLQRHGVIGHLLGERRSLCDALLEERLGDGLLVGVVGALEQSLIALAHVSVRGDRLDGGRPGLKGCQRSHKGLLGSRRTLNQNVSSVAERRQRRKIPLG